VGELKKLISGRYLGEILRLVISERIDEGGTLPRAEDVQDRNTVRTPHVIPLAGLTEELLMIIRARDDAGRTAVLPRAR